MLCGTPKTRCFSAFLSHFSKSIFEKRLFRQFQRDCRKTLVRKLLIKISHHRPRNSQNIAKMWYGTPKTRRFSAFLSHFSKIIFEKRLIRQFQRWVLAAAGGKKLENGKQPKLRTISKKRAESQPPGLDFHFICVHQSMTRPHVPRRSCSQFWELGIFKRFSPCSQRAPWWNCSASPHNYLPLKVYGNDDYLAYQNGMAELVRTEKFIAGAKPRHAGEPSWIPAGLLPHLQ